MERLCQTVVQLEEAKRFVLCGDIAHLRLALILLDNAVEVMMHRVIEDKFGHADMYARMLQSFPIGPLDPKGEELRSEISSHVVLAKKQKQVRRFFGEKVEFLSKEHDCIPGSSARALMHLHDYRNETQHQDRVRPESIRPVVLVLFDIAADFLVRLEPGMTVWDSAGDYSWMKTYGFQQTFADSETIRRQIAEQLRLGLPLDAPGVRNALVVHLTDRLDAMENELTFVAENTSVGPDRALSLKAVQFWDEEPSRSTTNQAADLQTFVAPFDLQSFGRWRAAVEALNTIDDKLEMFDQFATIEDEFEPLEKMIDDTVSAIDSWIQFEIDRRRGK